MRGFKLTCVVIVVGSALAPACGSGLTAPSCGEGELAVEGFIDGVEIAERYQTTSHAWVNLPRDGEPAYLAVNTAEGAVLRVEWGRTIATGQSSAASGYLDLSGAGGFEVGNCEEDGFVSEVTSREGGAEFLLERLHHAPYCGGAPVDGYLVGCVGFRPFGS
jgi:hypothetical protein